MTGDRGIDDLGSDFVMSCKINEEPRKDAYLARRSFHCLPVTSRARLSSERINSYAYKFPWRFNLSKNENSASHESQCEPLCSPVSGVPCPASSEYGEGSFNEISTKDHQRPLGCVSLLISELSQRRPGWSLFRRAFLCDKKNSCQAMNKGSAVQLAKQLPCWSSISSVVHPDHKPVKSDEIARSTFNGVTPVIPSFEVEDETKDLPKELLSLQEMYSSVCRLFSYKALEQATSNFSSGRPSAFLVHCYF